MSVMVCKKCGYQVDTDFHAEQMNDEGLCDACACEEFDVVRNTSARNAGLDTAEWLLNAEPEAIIDARK